MYDVYNVSGNNVESAVSIQKTIINHQSGNYGLINRVIPSTYTCQLIIGIDYTIAPNDGTLHACIVLASEDTYVLSSFTVPDIEGTCTTCIERCLLTVILYLLTAVYRTSPASRFPVYHTLISDSSDVCNSFCLVSIDDRISIQFTSPLATPTSSADKISSYLGGTGMKPNDVEVRSIGMSLQDMMYYHYRILLRR